MRSEWCITRDLGLEWGISFLLEISAYIKISVKKDQNNDVSTVRRSFSRWEVKKLACFLLGATWKWPSNGRNVVIPFLTLIFIFWNPFRKICQDLRLWLKVGILDYHISHHAWSQNLDTCVDFKNLRSLAIIGKENYTVQRSLESLWHTMVIPNADNNSCLVNTPLSHTHLGIFHFWVIWPAEDRRSDRRKLAFRKVSCQGSRVSSLDHPWV